MSDNFYFGLYCTSGDRRCKNMSLSPAFSSRSKKTLTSERTYSKTERVSDRRLTSPEMRGTVSAVRGRNLWARERVKAHTKRCREHISRQNLQHETDKDDSTADDASDFSNSTDELTAGGKLPISELAVDTSLGGSASTPKSSPASFSDVSVT